MKHYLVIALVVTAFIFLPGCWDFHSVDQLSFVTTAGIDQGPENRINLSVQVPIPQNVLPPVVEGGKTEKMFYSINTSAKTVNEAFDLLETRTDRSLMISLNKSIIIGEAAAREGVQPLLDFFTRMPQSPLQALIFITDQIRAEEVLKLTPAPSILPGMFLSSAGQSVTKFDETFFIPLWHFHQKLIHESKDAYAPLIKIDQPHQVYDISGLAVFNGDRMAGKLSIEETEAFGLVTGLSKAALTVFSSSQNTITLRTLQAKTKIKVKLRQGIPHFKINTAVNGSINELEKQEPIYPNIERYQKSIAAELQHKIEALIKKLQSCNSDVVNFGEAFRVQHQSVWKKTAWKKVYPTVPFSVQVKVKILSDGRFR